ncbi:hypothetical protein [Actinomadura sp. 3N407]|uniref:hypothetical protein n=1 Tax=Actinomadura sp. 3N407 TaxID=3457423 RepID=UPI003FCE3E22
MRLPFGRATGLSPRKSSLAAAPLDESEEKPPADPPPSKHIARAELTLAVDDSRPLRDLPPKPDPAQALAAAVYDVRQDLGERVDVCLDLLPATSAHLAHRRRQLQEAAHRAKKGGDSGDGLLGILAGELKELFAEVASEVGSRGTSGRTARRRPTGPAGGAGLNKAEATAALGKFATPSPTFYVQLLIRVESEIPGRAEAHLHQILAAFDQWQEHNWWRVNGKNLGAFHVGSDFRLFRRRFDRRFTKGEFAPRNKALVTAGELAGLLKPPTASCDLRNVARSGGTVPAPPRELPTYQGQPNLLPLGYVAGSDGTDRLTGVPLGDSLFGLFLGKSGYGKTELGLVQAIALAHAGHGVWFLDPHGDGRLRARPYLAHPHVMDRLWEIDLTTRDPEEMTAGWNPLSMEGRSSEDVQDIVGDIVNAFASAHSWGDSASRAQTILTKACETLAELSLFLVQQGRPDLQPTIFQIRTLLTEEDWRETILAALPDPLRRYWRTTFPQYPPAAIPVITNIIDRIDASTSLRAFLGASRSTYDVRRAMDTGRIVFVCPAGTGPTDRLISCLLIYNLFSSGLSRRNIPRDQRRPYFAWIDELTTVDGASKGHLAAITEQLRKYEVRLMAMTQMAQRLTPTTRQALLQNLSILSTTAADVDEATLVTRRWARLVEPETVTRLPRYHYVMSVTLAGQPTTPFRVRGAAVEEIHAELHSPENVALMDDAVTANLARQPVRDILEHLAVLDEDICDFLLDGITSRPPPPRNHQQRPTNKPPRPRRAIGATTEIPHPVGADDPPGQEPDNVRELRPRTDDASRLDWS